MIKKIIKKVKISVFLLFLFAFYWFLNNGFLTDSFWLLLQAGLFTIITFSIFKYRRLKLSFWFLLVGTLYVASSVFEILKYSQLSVMAASTGFGTLVILIICKLIQSSRNP